MAKYIVNVSIFDSFQIVVDAENIEQAEEIALETNIDEFIDEFNFNLEILDIEEINSNLEA